MTGDKNYSDELLNAYLDDELAADERKQLIEELRSNTDLRQRVCKLEQVRNMVQIAYHDIPVESANAEVIRPGIKKVAAVAATVFILLGSMIGWFAHKNMSSEPGLLQLAELQLDQPAVENNLWRVLMHVTSDDPYKLKALLDETENVLKQYQNRNQKVAIEILANGKGLNLLRDDKSPYGKRIAELNKRYENIAFIACAKAMQRIQQEQGKDVTLLPGTKISPSALQEVLQKQRDGWTYIKI